MTVIFIAGVAALVGSTVSAQTGSSPTDRALLEARKELSTRPVLGELSLMRDRLKRMQEDKLYAADFDSAELDQKLESLDRQLGFARSLPDTVKMVGSNVIKADPAKFPYQVALVLADANSVQSGLYCGGTLVKSNWVLTAAHCLVNDRQLLPRDVVVFGGATHLPDTRQGAAADSFYVHKKYDPATHDFDIALIKLARPMPNGTPVDVLPAAQAGLVAAGKQVVVSGWGVTAEGATTPSPDLLSATVNVIANADCNKPESYAGAVTGNMLCAAAGNNDACQGDSGGPAVVSAGTASYVAGVVSWGEGCGRPQKYGVYASLQALGPWVTKVLSKY